MAVESSDFNDQDILTNTRQESDGKGNVRFKYTLPDGHPITSEWISPDNKKKALMAWLDAVKSTAVARGNEVEAERNAKLRRAAQEKDPSKNTPLTGLVKSETPSFEIADDADLAYRGPDIGFSTSPATTITVDPLAFAQAQLRQAEALASKWRKVIAALG